MIKLKVNLGINFKEMTEKIEKEAQKVLYDLMNQASTEWQDEAGRRLFSTQRMYQNAVQTEVVSPDIAHVFLQSSDARTDFLVNAVEAGHGPIDIGKSTLGLGKNPGTGRLAAVYSSLGRIKANKPKKNPPYVDIPMSRSGGAESKNNATSWRRLTVNNMGSTPLKHPGIEARNIREYVVEFVEKEAPALFARELKKELK